MSDAGLRDLERRFAETGTLSDEIELLRARLRADTLTPERLQIAALASHPAAEAVAEEVPLVRPLKEIAAVFQLKAADLEEWFEIGCPRTPKGKRFSYDLAQICRWRNSFGPYEGPNADLGLGELHQEIYTSEATLRAMSSLDPELASRAVIAVSRRRHAEDPDASVMPQEAVWEPPNMAVVCYFEDVLVFDSSEARHRIRYGASSRPHTFPGILQSAFEAKRPQTKVKRLLGLVSWQWSHESGSGEVLPADVRATIGADVIPWALGYRDPVAERVKVREDVRRQARSTTQVRTAAVGGEVSSMIELAKRLVAGEGVDVDVPQAGRWLKRAIQEGTPQEGEQAQAAVDALPN